MMTLMLFPIKENLLSALSYSEQVHQVRLLTSRLLLSHKWVGLMMTMAGITLSFHIRSGVLISVAVGRLTIEATIHTNFIKVMLKI